MTYPEALTVTIEINSVDVTAYVPPDTLSVSNVLTNQVDTARLLLEAASDIEPREWQELVITSGANRIFGGYIVLVTETDGPNLDINYQVEASDYAIRLDKVIVKKEYTDETDAAIIEDLFDTYLLGEGYDYTTHVQEIKTYPRLRFNRKTLLECLIDLADLSRADWYVDPDKNLKFFERASNATPAPITISDTPDLVTAFPPSQITAGRDGVRVANRIEIVGGNFRSEDSTFILPGTGEDERIIVPFRFFAQDGETSVLIDRNDGNQAVPVWTPLSVKPGYISELSSTNDVLYYFQEKVIEQIDNWPDLPNAVRIRAKYEVPLRARVQDQNSIDFYGLILDDVIVDDDIIDKAVARAAGQAQLAQNAIAKPVIEFSTFKDGLRAGQILNIKNEQLDIDGDFLIHRIDADMGAGNFVRYTVTAGIYNPDLIDLMLLLARQAKPRPIWRDDEVLDELLQITDSFSFTEDSNIADSQPPYYFSEDPAEAFDWGFGTFDPVMTVLLSATFTDADSTLIQNYSPEVGGPFEQADLGFSSSMIIVSNRATPTYQLGRSAGAVASLVSNVKMTADMRLPNTTDNSSGFVFRYVDAQNYCFARIFNGAIGVNPKLSFVEVTTALGSVEKASFDLTGLVAAGDTLTDVVLEITGDSFLLSWNGNSLAYSSSLHSASVKHGVFTFASNSTSNRGWIDNLVIEG